MHKLVPALIFEIMQKLDLHNPYHQELSELTQGISYFFQIEHELTKVFQVEVA